MIEERKLRKEIFDKKIKDWNKGNTLISAIAGGLVGNTGWPEELCCTICMSGAVYQPVECKACQNLFCKLCKDKWEDSQRIIQGRQPSCPLCLVAPFATVPINRIVQSYLGRQVIPACKICKIEKQFAYEEYLKHLEDECPKVKVECPINDCSRPILRERLQDHLFEECQHCTFQCQGCNSKFIAQEYMKHDCIPYLQNKIMKQQEQILSLESEAQKVWQTNKLYASKIESLTVELEKNKVGMKAQDKKLNQLTTELLVAKESQKKCQSELEGAQSIINQLLYSQEPPSLPQTKPTTHECLHTMKPINELLTTKLIGIVHMTFSQWTQVKCEICKFVLPSNSKKLVSIMCTEKKQLTFKKQASPCKKGCKGCQGMKTAVWTSKDHKCVACCRRFQSIINSVNQKGNDTAETHNVIGFECESGKHRYCLDCSKLINKDIQKESNNNKK
ncbi:hypothetical protein FGO68_gene6787 [Halteria grandinella]|uniref:RING-type domain-containing protein n=1 Tax=Halteria grandinella TaxID=5974 RepID=A0A8J8T1G8_HALGN|nr:hypothetical protein FGO68_gene6787 [Halteria grandinella]